MLSGKDSAPTERSKVILAGFILSGTHLSIYLSSVGPSTFCPALTPPLNLYWDLFFVTEHDKKIHLLLDPQGFVWDLPRERWGGTGWVRTWFPQRWGLREVVQRDFSRMLSRQVLCLQMSAWLASWLLALSVSLCANQWTQICAPSTCSLFTGSLQPRGSVTVLPANGGYLAC